jgi:hypothetical protein
MIGVDLIGGIRRAYFEQRLPIKEIVRRLAVSRATVRRVIRSQKTEFKYERGVQPVPKLGEWVAVLRRRPTIPESGVSGAARRRVLGIPARYGECVDSSDGRYISDWRTLCGGSS